MGCRKRGYILFTDPIREGKALKIESVRVDEVDFKAVSMPTEKTCVLMIQGSSGFLACGYLNIEVANRLGEKVAIVKGVKSFQDMLDAPIREVSAAAEAAGIRLEMPGRTALKILGTRA